MVGGRLAGNGAGIVQLDPASEGSSYTGGLVIENNKGTGIYVLSDNTTIDGVTVRNNGTDLALDETQRAGVVVAGGSGSVIRNSDSSDTQPFPTQTYAVVTLTQATGTTMEGNRMEGNARGTTLVLTEDTPTP